MNLGLLPTCKEELESAVNDLTSDKVQLQTTMDLLDGALRTLEDLKPQVCRQHYELWRAQGRDIFMKGKASKNWRIFLKLVQINSLRGSYWPLAVTGLVGLEAGSCLFSVGSMTASVVDFQAKREEELEALKTAMCTLDKEGVEPMCKK